ncbi:MAG: glycosyltransferase family 4 protein [bacterium]|nr:glycosyltransferase family 4 protein [bacterium]
MKILIFSTAYFPHVGGAEVAVKEITDRIGDIAFDMITVRLNKQDKPQEKISNVNVYRLGWGLPAGSRGLGTGLGKLDKLLFPFRAARLTSKLHRQNNYEVIWSIMASFSGFAALFFKKKHPEVKFLITLQEGDDLRKVESKINLPFVKKWFKQIFTKADYVQCISHYLAKWAKEMGAKCPIEVVPNGVNQISDFTCLPARQGFQISDLRRLGLADDEKIILTTSRLVKKNGIDDLIKATQILITHYSLLVTLVICGTGIELNNLKSKIKHLKLEDKVKLVGFVKPEELSEYYAAADVFCRPSLSEGLGNSFLEAMAVGAPVVATQVGGIPDFLTDGKTGWFCKVNDPKSIAEKIKYILDEKNRDEVNRVIDNAKQMVLEKYNWDIIAPQMKNIFSALGTRLPDGQGSALG